MQKHVYKLAKIILILFFLIIINVSSIKSQDSITIQGYIYINGIKINADEISLMLPDNMYFGFIFNDGKYYFVFTNEEPTTGTFLVMYQDVSYTPIENLIMHEGEDTYDIDLHIETSNDIDIPDDENNIDKTNIQPKAKAGGPYYSIIDNDVNFDASASYDLDGTITNYKWDFGDGNTSSDVKTTHVYLSSGSFRVILTVEDNNGKTDIDITRVYITELPNNPPTKPIIIGSNFGIIRLQYNYTILSSDKENDSIQYLIDWGDETERSSSDFLINGTNYKINHSWIYAGIYTIKVFAIDEKNVVSVPTEIKVLINSIYCENIGYMIDFTNDGFYDLFHSNITNEETPTEFASGLYLIDYDNDGYFDYEFDIKTDTLNVYTNVNPESEKTTNFYDLILPIFPYLILGLLIIVSSIIVVLILKRFKKAKKKIKKVKVKKQVEEQKIAKEKPKIQEKQTTRKISESDYELKKIRDKIDKF